MEDFREFLLRVCHDLRTPLRSVRANAELLLKHSERRDSADYEQILGFIVGGAKKIDSLVDGLSSYSLALHVEARNFQPARAGVLLRAVLARLAAELAASGADVAYDDLPRIQGDPDRLMNLFENLVRNAIQHRGAAAPRIHIGAEARDGAWLFAVRDNGPGVDSEDLERMFQPFERLSSTGIAGAGLGLAICREIVVRHNGRIWAESTPGSGCAIFFTLPAAAGQEAYPT
jgi:two-component system, chemotaxis family, sensor kinase Cph1